MLINILVPNDLHARNLFHFYVNDKPKYYVTIFYNYEIVVFHTHFISHRSAPSHLHFIDIHRPMNWLLTEAVKRI